MSFGRSTVWIMTTSIGYGLGMTASTLLVGATARPLSPVLAGIPYVALYGAITGMVIALLQWPAIPRGAVRPFAWLVATMLGAGAGFAVASAVGEALANLIDPSLNVIVAEAVIEMSGGAVLGLGIGLAQWPLLRGHLGTRRSWLVASAVGAGLGYGAASAVLEVLEVPILKANLVPSFGAMLGLFVGLAQGFAWRAAPWKGDITPRA